MPICNTFRRLACDTWDEIGASRQVNHQLREDTFTDLNMLALKLRHHDQVKTRVYNNREEGRNGADWEWWFAGLNGLWIGFRVQAKIINNFSHEFEHLHYQNRNNVYQCDRLIQSALANPIPRIPLYCLYLQTNNGAYLNNWPCPTYPQIKDLFGCSLVSAFTIRQLRAGNHNHLTDLQNHIRPWHCLVCCNGYGNADFIRNIQAYALARFNLDEDIIDDLNVEFPEDFITEEPPQYVQAILVNENNVEIKSPDKELGGIMIYTEEE